MRLLIAEDDFVVATSLALALEHDGHAVDVVHNGIDAVWMAQEASFDAVVLDVSLPGLNGFDVCRRLRAAQVWTPILLLTGLGDVASRVEGLDAGADDYVVKPVAMPEVAARLRAITRRAPGPRPTQLCAGDLVVDPASHRAWRAGRELALTPKEFALLELLVRHRGEALGRAWLQEKLWDFASDSTSNIVDSLVRRLRAKVDDPFAQPLIETVRGQGYRLREI